jgi:hypothetical protein
MSHTTVAVTPVRSKAVLQTACERMGLEAPKNGVAELYSRKIHGEIVKLPGWAYPVAFDLEKGEVKYDNYNGAWGEQKTLDRLLNYCEAARIEQEAGLNFGHSVVSQIEQEDGSLVLEVAVAC